MKKKLFIILTLAFVIYFASKFSLEDFLLKQANKITMSGQSFDNLLSERHVLIKGLIVDTTLISAQSKNDLERFLNYQRTAAEDIHKILR